MLFVARTHVRLNVEIIDERLTSLDSRKCIVHVGQTRADRLHLRALQFKAGLDPLDDVIISQRLAIDRNIRAHDSAPPSGFTLRRPVSPTATRRSACLE